MESTPNLNAENELAEDLFEAQNEYVAPKHPLDNIALCLSGGGFRATSFSIGVLSYLHRIKYKEQSLLHSVKFITSTSGGTIANAAYSVSVYRETPFEVFYTDMRKKLDGQTLLKKAFDILKDKSQWTEEGVLKDEHGKETVIKKQRNLINAMAKTYDELLVGHATLATITEAFKNKPGQLPHLEETAFNTTEFNNGLAFYFQANGHKNFVRFIGNGYLRFADPAVVNKLKISDLIASSSCFPGGFEPMLYPFDYVHAGNADVTALIKGVRYGHNDPEQMDEVRNKPFSIMDGGIVDNMGLDCVLKADKSRNRAHKEPFDLILSCDVTSYFNDPLVKDNKPVTGFYKNFTLQGIINVFKASNIVLLLAVASIFIPYYPIAGYILLVPSLLLVTLYWIGFFKLRQAKKNKDGTAAVALRHIDFFLRLRLRDLLPMLSSRVASVSQLVGNLFLKQIRRGQYNFLFQVPAMKDRAIACLVYEFSTAHEPRRLKNLEERDRKWWPGMKNELMPSPKLQTMVDSARRMSTTLWFTDGDKQKKDELIATGQVTVCYSLIKHICRLEVMDSKYKTDAELQALKAKLLSDWKRFNAEPQFMIDKLDA